MKNKWLSAVLALTVVIGLGLALHALNLVSTIRALHDH